MCDVARLEYGCDCAGCHCEVVNGTAFSVAAETAHAVDATPTAAPTLLFEGAPVAGEWVVDDLTVADAERYEATFVAAIAAAVDVDERAVSVHFSEHFHEDHRRALEEEE